MILCYGGDEEALFDLTRETLTGGAAC